MTQLLSIAVGSPFLDNKTGSSLISDDFYHILLASLAGFYYSTRSRKLARNWRGD